METILLPKGLIKLANVLVLYTIVSFWSLVEICLSIWTSCTTILRRVHPMHVPACWHLVHEQRLYSDVVSYSM